MAKTILITGGSTGIGAATSKELAEGNTILIHYNSSKQPAEEVAAAVEHGGGTAHLFQADLTTEAGCRDLAEQVGKTVDHLDVLVNNAGGLVKRQEVWELEWDMMETIFALNTFSTMMMTRLMVPMLRKGTRADIINMTSIAMRTGSPTATIYAASKGAVDAFTRGAARALAPDIRVNAVAPGVILTPFHDKYTPDEQLEKFREATPVGEFVGPEEIARTVRYILDSRFLTGSTIDINGGMFMR
ncbi:MAG: SDR family NAD(P)-dependent oxidoreductase [Spirochaetaceae bacterium]